MTVLLYIFAAIGAVATIGGVIALIIDAAQTNEDMQYYLHTRFPELEKDISVKLAEFETKLNNEGFVHKDQYDEDWHQFDYRINTISDNMYEFDKRLDVVADDNGGLWNKMDELQKELDDIAKKTGDYNIRFTRNAASLKDIHERLDTAFHEISELSDRTVILKNRLDEDDAVINSLRDKVHRLDQKMMNDMLGCLPKTITGNSPYDIHLTEITVGDDPNQMSKGTSV